MPLTVIAAQWFGKRSWVNIWWNVWNESIENANERERTHELWHRVALCISHWWIISDEIRKRCICHDLCLYFSWLVKVNVHSLYSKNDGWCFHPKYSLWWKWRTLNTNPIQINRNGISIYWALSISINCFFLSHLNTVSKHVNEKRLFHANWFVDRGWNHRKLSRMTIV